MSSVIPNLIEIEDFPGYFAGENGLIYKKGKNMDNIKLAPKVKKSKKGFLKIPLKNSDSIYEYKYVHELIANAWLKQEIKEAKNLFYIEHKNKIVGDNRPTNLHIKKIDKNIYVHKCFLWSKRIIRKVKI